jgi:hypothetical protein
MRLTRVIAVGIIFASAGLSVLNAQTLRRAAPPADYPAASFKGKQYVDSRGCIYIRAGIDGNVTWVPRVNRSRKQVCGYKPTQVAKAAPGTRAAGVPAPVQILAAPAAKPAAKPAQTRASATRAPSPVPQPTVAKGRSAAPAASGSRAPVGTTARRPSPAPQPTVALGRAPSKAPAAVATTRRATVRSPGRKPSPAPSPTIALGRQPAEPMATIATTSVRVPAPAPASALTYTPSPAPKPTVALSATVPRTPSGPGTSAAGPAATQGGNCPNASAFSQQYINKQNSRYPVRCGPQAEAPVTIRTRSRDQSSLQLPPDTRVVPRHVADNRQNTTNVTVPAGYRPVWEDDRLNPNRAEHTLRPAVVQGLVTVPSGFKVVDWGDGRLNPNRGAGAASDGDAQTGQIWTETVPRRLIKTSAPGPVVTVERSNRKRGFSIFPRIPAEPEPTVLTRLSTRSAPVLSPGAAGRP